jgi:hypothetical protein
MRLDQYFDKGMMPTVVDNKAASIPLTAFAFGPAGMQAQGSWAEIYRVAYERTMEALRPTRYDRAMLATDN